ncbi:RNI-like protein [Schizopora paradoxa]|uniref:RNI-like protein n=1 Tax=Schizopora paradoxa TaxID=27342 RepID=A0A0H2RTJ8_9AGAM|nr:RNI-like protein [Schizopora paradoxa]
MLSPSSSSSPSSSAVTLPRPGKSILKRPPPPQQSFFSLSRLSRLLPSQAPSPSASSSNASTTSPATEDSLKRAHFFLPHLTTIYPISAATPPCGPNVREEKKSVETKEAERRRRIVRGNSLGPGTSVTEEWWSPEKVESFYNECCAGREEQPHPGISAALKRAKGDKGRSLDLSGVQLTLGQAATLSDVFSVEWGLRKLVLKECDLDEHILKPILHALSIPASLNFLSVSSNRKLKTPAFRLIGSFVQKTRNLQFLDLSQNFLDKKSVEYIGAALRPANETGLISLRLDDCSLRPPALECLAQAVRTSSLRNISLRYNKISPSGAVAIALMIKDYPDAMPSNSSSASSTSSLSSPTSTLFGSLSPPSTPTTASPPLTPIRQANPLPSLASGIQPPPQRNQLLPPPPVHPASVSGVKTTYTPYVPRSRARRATPGAPSQGVFNATVKAVQNATLSPNPLSATGQQVPIITSSAQGGVTTRHAAPSSPLSMNSSLSSSSGGPPRPSTDQGPSVALLEKVRALDSLPRLGELRTLDLRGNDIKAGISYVAQVLKRNRTLKVMNLCENKLDVMGLAVVAEALKYNLTLETLDLSKNPCSGPSLQGIQALRTAFTTNTSLKRLFLSTTSMGSAGAIALAEFLPESTSLLHLDLTSNNLELAGVMALSRSLKANHVMRCLDLNIPPADEEYARMCRDILNTCVRNTEEAERNNPSSASSGRGQAKGVWGMIEESELAKRLNAENDAQKSPTSEDPVSLARECEARLKAFLSSRSPLSPSPSPEGSILNGHAHEPEAVDVEELRAQSMLAIEGLSDVIQAAEDPVFIEELFFLNDSISSLVKQLSDVKPMSRKSSISGSSVTTVNGGLMLHIPNNTMPRPSIVTPDEEDEETIVQSPETPRIDKGKGRAAPEPEIHEKVLSPSFLISDEEDEDGNPRPAFVSNEPDEMVVGPSPTDLSKVWVEEEGEVFRKGNALLGPEELEGEYDGEELRIELLEAEVERPPPRSISVDDEFISDLPPLPMSPALDGEAAASLGGSPTKQANELSSPTVESITSPLTPISPGAVHSPVNSGPLPYLPRRRSSSSALSTGSGPSS